jgi:hypothetical protein
MRIVGVECLVERTNEPQHTDGHERHRGLFRTSEDYFHARRVAIGDGPLSGRIGFAYSTYRKRTVERVLYHRVLSL